MGHTRARPTIQHQPTRIALFVLLTCMLVACGATAPAAQPPIKIGAIAVLSGPVTYPSVPASAKAVFDRVNAQGGIKGRMIEYNLEDDKFDPATSTQAARRLVDEQGVVALVGSASLTDCATNAAYYQQKQVLVIPGIATSPDCFNSANIAPSNAGALNGMTLGLYFASNILKRNTICTILVDAPGVGPVYDMVVNRWKQISGKDLAVFEKTFKATDDPTPFVLKIKQGGCEAVMVNGLDQQAIAIVRSAKAQNVSGVDWIFLTPTYTAEVAKTLASDGEGIYAMSEYEPFTGDAAGLADWRNLMTEKNVPLSAFSQGGYLAATIMVDTLKQIEGEITRESVTEALRKLEQYQHPLIGSPYAFGPGDRHNPNQSAKFVQLKAGQWQVVTPEFVTLP